MSYAVGFEDKQVIFSGHPEASVPGEVVIRDAGPLPVTKLLQIVGNSKTLRVISGDPKASFEAFGKQYRTVEAAGGLVTDPAGNVLMIRRRNRWDLPKGHCEKGETAAEAGVREVREECGIEQIENRSLITETWHGYLLDGEWVLKRTSWFEMRVPQPLYPVTPQTEEGITEAAWIAPDRLPEALSDTYPSVRQVFAAAGYDT